MWHWSGGDFSLLFNISTKQGPVCAPHALQGPLSSDWHDWTWVSHKIWDESRGWICGCRHWAQPLRQTPQKPWVWGTQNPGQQHLAILSYPTNSHLKYQHIVGNPNIFPPCSSSQHRVPRVGTENKESNFFSILSLCFSLPIQLL